MSIVIIIVLQYIHDIAYQKFERYVWISKSCIQNNVLFFSGHSIVVSVCVCSQVWNTKPAHWNTVQLHTRDPQPWNAALQDDSDIESEGRGSDEIIVKWCGPTWLRYWVWRQRKWWNHSEMMWSNLTEILSLFESMKWCKLIFISIKQYTMIVIKMMKHLVT